MTRFILTHKWIRHAIGVCLFATPFICLTSCDPADLDPVGNMESATTSNQAPNDTGTTGSTEGNGTDTDPATGVCGNGVVETAAGETCDDGNTHSNDGCSADCQLETGSDPVCGNGVLEDFEKCDDANTISADGCSNECVIECGYRCDVPGAFCAPDCSRLPVYSCIVPESAWDECCETDTAEAVLGDMCENHYVDTDNICGNGLLEPDVGEACDDGNTQPGDGCSADCQPETMTIAVCGNGVLESGETCDDGNTLPDDGCTETCNHECGYLCTTPGVPCELECARLPVFSCIVVQSAWATCCPDADTDTLLVDMCEAWYPDTDDSSICGNGILEMNEACDDGNTASDDGCSGDCQAVEDFF